MKVVCDHSLGIVLQGKTSMKESFRDQHLENEGL